MDFQEVIKKNKLLFLIILFALIIRIIFIFSTPLKIWDETVYANLGYDLSKDFFDYSFNNGWSDFIPSKPGSSYGWPQAGFRAPLLPYLLSLFYFIGLPKLVIFIVPIMGVLNILVVYLFSKKMFNKSVALYSAILLSLIPIHVIYSSQIMTDAVVTLFISLTFLFFWKGFEENHKLSKVLFGVFFALSLLSRYTTLWIAPIFLIYFLIRDKSLIFMKDRHFWYSVISFFIFLIPLFIYGFFTYGNILGAFLHGFEASSYWGGIQDLSFFLEYWKDIFSVVGVIFLLSLLYLLYNGEIRNKQVYLLLIWVCFFFIVASSMPHKEDRFILPIIPPICIIASLFLDKLKKGKTLLLILIILILTFSLFQRFSLTYQNSYTDKNLCFFEANNFINKLNNEVLVVTDESPIVYYYSKKETMFYPGNWDTDYMLNLVNKSYTNISVMILFSDFDMSLDNPKNMRIKDDLEINFNKIFECKRESGFSAVYS